MVRSEIFMCGIVGYVGDRQAAQVLRDSLSRLEYRGYDSVGISVLNEVGITTVKAKGRIADVAVRFDRLPQATMGIGHSRWATHGVPSDVNAHPHCDCTGKIALVHNGIIENHHELRKALLARGHRFKSETDTEVAVHIIEENYDGDLLQAVLKSVPMLEGSMAIVVMHADEPGRIVVYRARNPLVIGIGENENFIASDIPALLPYTRRVVALSDGEYATVEKTGVTVYDGGGRRLAREAMLVDVRSEEAEKGGFDHFMLKEIHEQPQAFSHLMSGRLHGDRVVLGTSQIGLSDSEIRSLQKVFVVACGTAYHAGLVGKVLIERLAAIPTEVVLASEFRYGNPIVPEGTLCIAVSQSGETADTLAAEREARRLGARLLAILNSPLSTLAGDADGVFDQRGGPEIAVASTKAYTTQVLSFALLAVKFGEVRGTLSGLEALEFVREMKTLPGKAQEALATADAMRELANRVASAEHVFFLGRGLDYVAALEGQLKLKEISYIHSEAYAAGELKHGPLALIQPGVPVVVLATDPALATKTASNVMEVKARGGWIIAIGAEECLNKIALDENDARVAVPTTNPLVSPAISVIPLQLLSYFTALARGNDVDKPRNLAKSVTVE
jgi:glucosamine--fructose-6-phosphate aminotransferase (isomerizing)